MNAENLVTLSKELEAAQLHLNKLAGQIVEAAAELENLWTRIDLATVQLADPAELRESARRVLEKEATPEELDMIQHIHGLDLQEGTTRLQALHAIYDKPAGEDQSQSPKQEITMLELWRLGMGADATPESLIDALTESVSSLQNECADLEAENADLHAQLDALTANR